MTAATWNRFPIERRPEFAAILRAEPFGNGSRGLGDRLNAAFDRLVHRSGLRLAPAAALRLCILGATAIGGALYVSCDNLLWASAGTVAGALLPLAVLALVGVRRRSILRSEAPVLIVELTRAARSGRGLVQCLEETEAIIPSPWKDELAPAVRKLQMGLGVDEALGRLPESTGLACTSILVAALAAHERGGADLVGVLESLAKSGFGAAS